MVRRGYVSLATVAASSLRHVEAAGSEASIRVAEVKPHYGCWHGEGHERVRQHITGLADESYGLIALLQVEFPLSQLEGYAAFGASCKDSPHADPAVVLVNTDQFAVVSTIGDTVFGNFAEMPFLSDGRGPANGGMCMADPNDTYPPEGSLGSAIRSSSRWPGGKVGTRPYAAAVLQHKASGQEVCVLTGTFPHCMWQWDKKFTDDIASGCGSRQLIVIADTNAGCEQNGPEDSQRYNMQRIAEEQGVDWGSCSDPGPDGPPTCCDDISYNVPYPRYWYDRIAICRGGRVEQFEVLPAYVCQDSDAEHRFTTALVHLEVEASAV